MAYDVPSLALAGCSSAAPCSLSPIFSALAWTDLHGRHALVVSVTGTAGR